MYYGKNNINTSLFSFKLSIKKLIYKYSKGFAEYKPLTRVDFLSFCGCGSWKFHSNFICKSSI